MDRVFVFIRRVPLTRQTIYVSLLLCFLFPPTITFFCGLGALSLVSLALAAASGWLLMQIWEKKMQNSVTQLLQAKMEKIQELPPPSIESEQQIQQLMATLEKTKIGYEHQINLLQSSVAKSKDDVHQLHLEMDRKLEQMRLAYHEFEDLRKNYTRLEEESNRKSEEWLKKMNHKDSLLAEYQKTISEQRVILEKKQRYVAKLEGKVRDLMYEIRSLLQLEPPSEHGEKNSGLDTAEQAMIDSFLAPPQTPHTPYDFSVQVKKYIEKVENLTGVDHLGYMGGKSPRFLDLSLESYAFDRRHLFDNFKDETLGIIFIFSPIERKFLFVNHVVKSLTGWSAEKFIKDFPRLVVHGYSEWEEAIFKLKTLRETSIRLSVLNKMGKAKSFECYMGAIAKGPFAGHIIGLLTQ